MAGDVIVLTKPLGTQIAVNAHQWLDQVLLVLSMVVECTHVLYCQLKLAVFGCAVAFIACLVGESGRYCDSRTRHVCIRTLVNTHKRTHTCMHTMH